MTKIEMQTMNAIISLARSMEHVAETLDKQLEQTQQINETLSKMETVMVREARYNGSISYEESYKL